MNSLSLVHWSEQELRWFRTLSQLILFLCVERLLYLWNIFTISHMSLKQVHKHCCTVLRLSVPHWLPVLLLFTQNLRCYLSVTMKSLLGSDVILVMRAETGTTDAAHVHHKTRHAHTCSTCRWILCCFSWKGRMTEPNKLSAEAATAALGLFRVSLSAWRW